MAKELNIKLIIFALILDLTCSANLLTYIGIPYVSDGGSFILKIHPGSYVSYAASVVSLAGTSMAARTVPGWIGPQQPNLVYFASISFCILYALLLTGRGNLIVLFDTFLPAGIAASLCYRASERSCLVIRRTLQLSILLNAVIALGEAATHTNVIPLYLDEAAYKPPQQEFRPTALFDHPLTGGMVTMIGLALTPACGWARPSYALVLTAALVAFGGRVAVAMSMFSVLVYRLVLLGGWVLRREVRAGDGIAGWTILLLVLAAFLTAAMALGLGERLSGHLYWDASAQVRLNQWGVIGELDLWEVLFGARRDELIALLTPLWLTSGVEVIENFWLLMFVSLGVVGFAIFLAGFSSLLLHCLLKSSLRGRILLVATIIAASTSNSLGRKSSLLVILVAATSCFAKCKDRTASSRPIRTELVRPITR